MKPLVIVVLLVFATGCSIRRLAVNQVGNALASGGTTFTSDDDPDLVAAAIPFGLKLTKACSPSRPSTPGFCWRRPQGFTEYSYAFVDSRIDEAKGESLDRANASPRARPQALPARQSVRHARPRIPVSRVRRSPG